MKCHVCGASRSRKGVVTTDRSIEWDLPLGNVIEHVYYCAEDPLCRFRAWRMTLKASPHDERRRIMEVAGRGLVETAERAFVRRVGIYCAAARGRGREGTSTQAAIF